MKLKAAVKKFSFIFTMLVFTLAVFCVSITPVKADNAYFSESIFDFIENNTLTDGYYTVTVVGKTSEGIIETKTYSVHFYNFDGDQVWSENKTFGDAADVATASTNAQNMVIVKVNGNLTINEGVTVTTYNDSKYGGSKGFTLYVTGDLINNGTITGTKKGAKAEGENVYLFKNVDGSFEYVPAQGAEGGASISKVNSAGKKGATPVGRQSGGGGSGGGNSSSISGRGGRGTSYSGGPGGGGANASIAGEAGSDSGGQGGKSGNYASGGTGNPGGAAGTNGTAGKEGTGGLLIIRCNSYGNNGVIESNGTVGGSGVRNGGGGSGGGSINIFTTQETEINQTGILTNNKYVELLKNTVSNGGAGGPQTSGSTNGGEGGNGAVSIGEIRNGQYYDLKEIIEQDKQAFMDSVTIEGESILKILEENDLQTGYYVFKVTGITDDGLVETKKYMVNLQTFNGNQVWTEDKLFGDSIDVATSETDAQNMIIVKVNGNLTINEGVTVTTYNDSKYGGSKGFTLYVTGKLTNNGTISGTKKGAKGAAENVYLWKNADGTFEYVPAEGAAGGEAIVKKTAVGNKGVTPVGRQTGGGGSGGSTSSTSSGRGGKGTSYSGGAGGGGANGSSAAGGDGSDSGGQGGTSGHYGSAGTGNPGGAAGPSGTVGKEGTGGLLVLYCDEYENNGNIEANGNVGGSGIRNGGGGSGGGSINIFTNQPTNINETGVLAKNKYAEILSDAKAAGGAGGPQTGGNTNGGEGGDGAVSIGEIRNGQYYDLIDIIEQDKETFLEGTIIEGESILKILEENDLETGYYTFKITGITDDGVVETKKYMINLQVFDGDQVWSENKIFGSALDVATSETDAQNMIIAKVKGNLTINEGVTITTYRDETYGGSKGFTLYVTGKLTNNGTISATNRGAKGAAENVYLWKNADGTFEYIPAEGAAGGAAVEKVSSAGKKGATPTGRQTGGGGSGGSTTSASSGRGGKGTSYSGGAGGGGANGSGYNGGAGSDSGGQGGISGYYASGGTGNPGGAAGPSGIGGKNGTGGLLVLYCDEYENNGNIEANGNVGGSGVRTGGGGSGGGSINIFTNQQTNVEQPGLVTSQKYNEILKNAAASGGAGGPQTGGNQNGGAGGDGAVSIGEIRNNQYYDLKEIIEQDKQSLLNSLTIEGESILKIIEDNEFEDGYYGFKVEGKTSDNVEETKTYKIHMYNFDGDQVWNSDKTFGDLNDIATELTESQNMIVVKVNGDLTISEGVKITTFSNQYGGPKGFLLYVTGKLTNNGQISQTGKGARAVGENVYLLKNPNSTFEYVPAVGGAGGTGNVKGTDGIGRQTGGGAGGGTIYGGSGSSGTSYSGGSGGGGSYGASYTGVTSAAENGGAGGKGTQYSAGGAGNPGGTSVEASGTGNNGTGGLLIIYTQTYENLGTVEANGIAGGVSRGGGGGSGGGSINIFYNSMSLTGTASYSGGAGGRKESNYAGADGGTGTISYAELPKPSYITKMIVNNVEIPNFDKEKTEYDVTLNKYDVNYNIVVESTFEDDVITNIGIHPIEPDTTEVVDLVLTNKFGMIKTYTLTITNLPVDEHNSKLKSLYIKNYENKLNPIYHPLTGEYNIKIPSSELNLDVECEAYDSEASILVEGNKYIRNDTGQVIITVSESNVSPTTYIINYKKVYIKSSYEFPYKGEEQTFEAPYDGDYKLEVWGASGGDANSKYIGGYGGYSVGSIYLKEKDNLFVIVGREGLTNGTISYNGGGKGVSAGGGGGATHIATIQGELSTLSNNRDSILIVAGGGGGGVLYSDNYASGQGGSGGGFSGHYGIGATNWGGPGVPGTQEKGGKGTACGGSGGNSGSFGQGANGGACYGSYEPGGGGGYYGGGATRHAGSGGGSGYIANKLLSNKQMYMYCSDSCSQYESDEESIKTTTTTNYSDKAKSEYAKDGNGYAIITPLYETRSRDNYLTNLVVSNPKTGEHYNLDKTFDPIVEEYNLSVGVNETKVYIEARPSSDLVQSIIGIGEQDVHAGRNTYEILVTSESGDIRIYKVNVTREASTIGAPKNITITGLVDRICNLYEGYCELDSEFRENKHMYYMTVPSGIREVEFTVEKAHEYQTVIGEGVTRLQAEDNTITIEITSEDEKTREIYIYEIYRDITGDNYIDKIEFINPENLDIGFNYLIQEYTFKVENNIENLEMKITTDDPKATYEVYTNGVKDIQEEGSESITTGSLKVGNNVIEIVVKAQNEEERIYILNVYRVTNDNALLESLTVKTLEEEYILTPKFKDIIFNYTLTVENEVEEIEVLGAAYEGTTTVIGNNKYQLKTGVNNIKITTTAEQGNTEIYTITVTRKKNDNTYLSVLSVEEINIFEEGEEFDKEKEIYNVEVNPYIKKLTITAKPEVSTSKVSISGNSNFKVGENIVKITVTAENNEERNYYIIVNKEGSDNNYLSELHVKNESEEIELTPSTTPFDKDNSEYSVEVENNVETIIVSGVKEDTLSSVSGLKTYNLKTGLNIIKVIVTSETGIVREYTINVTRKYNNNALLKSLTVNKGTLSPSFNQADKVYTVNVENEINKITITATPYVNTTTVIGNGEKALNVGENIFEILTEAEDKTTTEKYIVNVTRDAKDNANLSYLNIREAVISPTFDPMTISYTAKVPNIVDEITVDYIKETEGGTVTVNKPSPLVIGENIVIVTVTSESETSKEYKIVVTRQDESNDLNLKTLNVTNCILNFNKNTQYYECEVKYEVNKVIVSATAEDESNVVLGTGEKTLSVGRNILPVIVKNTNLEEKDYQIEITRKESSETRLTKIEEKTNTFEENYSPDVREYHISTKEEKLELTITKMHEGQEVEIIGNENFTLGENIVIIKVKAANKIDEDEYKIYVEKEKSDNAYLKNLSVEGYEISPSFNKGIYEYTLKVSNKVEDIIVNAEIESKYASITGLGHYYLETGENIIKVKVEAEDGITQKEYVIKIEREQNDNAYLKSLEVEGYEISPVFDKDIVKYTVEVEDFNVESIKINAIAEEETSIVTGTGILNVGIGKENKVAIIVTSEKGSIKTYTITVTFANKNTSLLKNIKIKNYELDPGFESNTLEYNVEVDNEIDNISKLEFTIEKIDPNGTYTIELEGKEDGSLEVGEINKVKVVSKSSDGQESTTYIINVTRRSYSNTYLKNLSVSEGELDPEFNKETLEYNVEVGNSVEKIIINAGAEVATSSVSGTGEKELKVGKNKYIIEVTSSAGVKRNYIINIRRKAKNDTGITRITSNVGKLTKIDENEYKLVVAKTVQEITSTNITVETEDPQAIVEKEEKIILSEDTEYNITVTSTDSSVSEKYVIKVEYEKSGSTYLKKLVNSVGEMSPSFTKTTRKYIVDVRSNVEEIEFEAETEVETSEIINSSLLFELKEGNSSETIIKINVQAEDGDIGVYEITVRKSISVERGATNIIVGTYGKENEEIEVEKEKFNETTYEYNMTVPYEVEKVNFAVIKKHPNQEVKIYINNEIVSNLNNLKIGLNTYVVEITNGLNTKIEYVYNIQRLKSTNNYLKSLKLISPEYEFKDFEKNKQEYYVTIPYDYENVNIEAIPEDELNASVRINGTVGLISGMVNDVIIKVESASEEIREYIIHVLRTPRVNNMLQTLTVSSGEIYTLSPKFNPGITEYEISVPSVINKIQIDAIAGVETAKISQKQIENKEVIKEVKGKTGEFDLKVGINVIKVEVTLEEQTREYTLVITRKAGQNAYLEDLKIINGILNEEFTKEKGKYTANIGYEEENLQMEIQTEDENATYEVIGNANLRYGENEVRIKVTSSDKSVSKTYTIIVTKEGDPENRLEYIKINEEEIEEFDKEKEEYEIEVENEESSIEIQAKAISKNARVIGEGYYSLEEGENKIIITVIGQNGSTKRYTINITRKKSAYLKDIIVDEGEIKPEFKKDILEYEVEVKTEIEKITVMGIEEDSEAAVEGNGKYELKIGENEIKIKVISADKKTEKEYKVKVKRKGSSNTYLKYLTLTNGLLSPVFEKDTIEYIAYIPDDQNKLGLDYEVEDKTSNAAEIGNEEVEDEGIVKIKVTSTDLSEREYKIKVVKEEASLFSNRLLDIKTDKGILSPKFDPDNQEYTLTVGNTENEIQVNAVRESLEATVIGVGTHKIVEGRNVLQILVTSKDLKTRIYTIIVYKVASNDARLKELEFNEGVLNPIFNKNIYNYTLIVECETKSISIKKIVPVEEGTTYEVQGDTILEEGKTNIIEIKTVSPDTKEKKTYKITVKREKSSNAYLKSLTTNKGEFKEEFEKTKKAYTKTVGNEVESIIIQAEAESSKAKVKGTGYYKLEIGKNYISVEVEAENGSKNVYNIVIEKEKNRNNYLKEIYVRGYEFKEEYERERREYTLEVENEEISVILEAIAEEATTNVIGLGEKTLIVGENEFEILSVSESGDIREYKIIVTRKKLISSKLNSLKVEEGIINPTFDKETYEYYISVPNEYTSLTIEAIAEEIGVEPEIIGNSNFKVGSNEITIKVESSSGEISEYILHVTRQVSSNNYLKKLSVSEGEITPSFEKTKQKYTVEVENNIEKILVSATPEVTTSSVRGIGEYELEVGKNEIIVYVRSEIGLERSYVIEVIRKGNSNKYLEYIKIDGEIIEGFNKEKEEYEIEIEKGTEKIEVEAKAEEKTTTVSGEGEYKTEIGERNITIIATAEDGGIKEYKIKVRRPADTSKKVLKITASEGEITPNYDDTDETKTYEVKVGSLVNIITFEVETESSLAKVSGNKDIILKEGENEVTIKVEAEDKSYKEIKIKVIKEASITGIKAKENKVLLIKGEEYEIQVKAEPDESVEKEYIYETKEEVVEVTEKGKVIAKEVGTTKVEIKVKGQEEIKTEIEIEVVSEKITSSIYEVREEEKGRIIIGAEEGEKIKEFLDKLDNPESMLKVYDKEGEEITDYENIITTGMRIKLEKEEKEYDEVIIIVRGDINEDGQIDVSDQVELKNHILSIEEMEDYRIYAADVEEDGELDVTDSVKIADYILSKISTLN